MNVGLGQSWYLADEMIMFWFTPLMLIPVHYIGRKFGTYLGMVVAFSYGVAATILVLTYAIVEDLPFSYQIQA